MYCENYSSTGIFSTIKNQAIAASFVLVVSLFFCQNASSQTAQIHPVARLITGRVNDAAYSRPRRVAIDTTAATTDVPSSPGFDEANAVERSAFEQTNRARVANGLEPFAWDPDLCRMARVHSENMARQGFFDHETREGLHLKDRARALGIGRFRVIGENIAYNKGYEDPGAFAVERWMLSSGHRANILYAAFQASAIGSYVSTDGSVYLTQIFISR
ncbi:MAG: CAP domain-containing protein [Acidobacteriota bacterium]|nr:CAP domain-containing protein [Acidobacteriota bacterium]